MSDGSIVALVATGVYIGVVLAVPILLIELIFIVLNVYDALEEEEDQPPSKGG